MLLSKANQKYLLVAAGTVVSTIFIFGVYKWLSGKKRGEQEVPPALKDGQSIEQRAREFIKAELGRLKNPKLITDVYEEDETFGLL